MIERFKTDVQKARASIDRCKAALSELEDTKKIFRLKKNLIEQYNRLPADLRQDCLWDVDYISKQTNALYEQFQVLHVAVSKLYDDVVDDKKERIK